MPAVTNATIRKVHTLLVKRVGTLSTQLGKTSDPTVAERILVEMEEVVHRVNLLQRVMFAATSAKLEALLPAVQEADKELTDALEDVAKIAKFVKATGNLLAKVDTFIDLAKTLMPV